MGRKVKGKTLDTIEARRKVKPQGKPYYRAIDRGLHLGYRKLKGQAGTWLARHYLGDQAYEVEAAVISPSETAASRPQSQPTKGAATSRRADRTPSTVHAGATLR